uniref:Fork-head domain-containing protein n=1 Tax=Gouania willdenowi TaxID=441366 RepID=A0A8C5EKQ8_GOUWI
MFCVFSVDLRVVFLVIFVSGDSGFSDSPESFTSALHSKQEPGVQDMRRSEEEESERSKGGKKKNYQRYPKPPYTYLAMIAMVIQRSAEKKLTLSEILKEVSTLFPFFKGNYKGWRDSVRHNLSSYDCFVKVLKDPAKPHGKGNFWAVELGRVPLELLKRQNTAVSRQDETVFAQDLAPYIMKDYKPEPESLPDPVQASCSPRCSTNPTSLPQDDSLHPKLDSSFAIDSLLHSLRPSSASEETDAVARSCWADVGALKPSPVRHPCYACSARSASASSVSPASSSSSSALSDDEWRGASHHGKRGLPDGEAPPGVYDGYMAPLHKSSRREAVAPPWELPTSYAKYAPPNAVAPPSMRFSGAPLMALHGGLSMYGYASPPVTTGHFIGHGYWPLFPSRQVAVQAPPPLLMDLDNLLQSVPPNKSVFDALTPASQSQQSYHPQSQYGTPRSRYHQY